MIEQRFEMAHLLAVMPIDRHRHNLLLFLIPDERGLQPEDGLRKVQGTDPSVEARLGRQDHDASHSGG